MASYSFPLLHMKDILLDLHELHIRATEEDLLKPSMNRVHSIFASLVELLLNKKVEEMATPAFSGMNELEYPQELHEESVPMAGFLCACQDLMTKCGIKDFAMYDVMKPEPKRLRRNLSAVINFAKFREERFNHYITFSEETDTLISKKQGLEEENERLLTDLQTAKAQRAKEAPEEQRLKTENAEREAVVLDLFHKQTEKQKASQALKAKLLEVQTQVDEAKAAITDAQQEAEELHTQIVPDPRRLVQEMQALREAVQTEKDTVKHLEAKCWEYTKQSEVLDRTEHELTDMLTLQAEAETEYEKLKEVVRRRLEIAEQLARQDDARSDLFKIKSTCQRLQQTRERMERQQEQQARRLGEAQQALSESRAQLGDLRSKCEAHSHEQDQNEVGIRELQYKLVVARSEDEQAAARMLQLQQRLSLQVRAYHQNLFAAMGVQSAHPQMVAAA
mmetsp:Transcript_13811/g.29931  ORF Transcript_13811/g.29931 Transcript_13811/m.29931 type:complete len:449 (-) Transcript_13811:659-2005(-)|eukprot:CAMPEP_0183336470 /NCGR_PEP_ID=MMETSP0164_2-20130417/4436_1 /TAXON_ID=221442 /ORGANISM="Coccolithus pelagicus ssp braarudi, Strain PLY182g" /LENGTH=448 /DNA_ID=CAMNT_0025505993 /DNA_START=81 /DNA_END=1427 /DNA_ORIENTATION=+